jgi:hypothetical protein
MGLSVMGMRMVMMQVVRHAGLRPVEWREYSTRTEFGNYPRSAYSPGGVALLALLFWPFYKTMEVFGPFSLVLLNPALENQFANFAEPDQG